MCPYQTCGLVEGSFPTTLLSRDVRVEESAQILGLRRLGMWAAKTFGFCTGAHSPGDGLGMCQYPRG